MSSIEAWIIIILVVGVVASNLAVLKYSSKFKMPQFGQDKSHDLSLKSKAANDETPQTEQASPASDTSKPEINGSENNESEAEIKK
ncbi:DUF2897 family protein [Shewanella sp. A25]|nr:DUF2897 family protein [Shewanella shenzhenensis]